MTKSMALTFSPGATVQARYPCDWPATLVYPCLPLSLSSTHHTVCTETAGLDLWCVV